MLMHGVRSKPLKLFEQYFFERNFMNLQRISEFAENQEGETLFYCIHCWAAYPAYIRKFSPK